MSLLLLVYAGLLQVSRAQGEMLGRSCPPPLAVTLQEHSLRLSFYEQTARLPLPAPICRFLSHTGQTAAAGWRLSCRWFAREIAAGKPGECWRACVGVIRSWFTPRPGS